MPSFLPSYGWFALAGAIAATTPVIIHLLNRRRFRTVRWAAMDFLRAAMQRSRRILQLRDILLMALRAAAFLLFGLALARPFFQQNETTFDPNSPLHVALIVDNSLSTGYQQRLGKRVLEDVKERSKEMIAALPERSLIAVVPLCGTEFGRTRDSYRSPADAIEAVERIDVVDRRGTMTQAVDLALEAFAGSESDESARRIVVVTDNQIANWPPEPASRFKDVPDLVVVDAAAKETSNAWVESVGVADGVADTTTETTIVAKIRYEGADRRPDVNVNLTINGEIKESKKISLESGQTLETTFRYRFAPEERLPSGVDYVNAAVSLDPDQLPDDDIRYFVIPVALEVNVLFIDQYGSKEEDPRVGRLGETYSLRSLLAPRVSRGDDSPQLIKVKHIALDELTRESLRDARLVVVAGLASPGESVELLRDYVRQGGPLLIAAGGNFNPAEWNSLGWKDGAGILPAPLSPDLFGKTVDEIAGLTDLLTINPDSLSHSYFQFPDASQADQAGFYLSGGGGGFKPIFTKTAEVKFSKETLADLRKLELARLTGDQKALTELDQQEKTFVEKEKRAALNGEELAAREKARELRATLEPNWLSWSSDLPRQRDPRLPAEKLVELGQPRVLATLSNGMPLFVERRIGEGTVVFFSSGLLPKWNLLANSGVFVVMDRIARGLIEATLPRRNLSQVEQFTLPVNDTLLRYSVKRPGRSSGDESREEPLAIEALGPDEYGVIVRNAIQRGIYRIQARRVSSDGTGDPVAVIPFAVNGPGTESRLVSLGRAGFDKLLADAPPETSKHLIWIDRGAPVNLAGTTAWGRDLWWWFALAMLLCLLIEMGICAWPAWNARPASPGTSVAASVG